MIVPFADRTIEAVRRLRTPLCIGLDPFADRIPTLFGDARTDPRAFVRFFEAVLELAAGAAAVVKPQVGLFEPYGAEGVAALEQVVAAARSRGLLVLLDAKHGDIASTAEGYAVAALGPPPGLGADAVTVNPYLGRDSLAPFLALAAAEGKGVAVLVRTSNPGARDLQDLQVDGAPLWQRVAEMIGPDAAALRGASGWSGLMAVAGATYPEEARRLRALLPDSLFLIPGFGAQGASAADAAAGFIPGPAGREGGLINASRAVLYPHGAESAATLPAWRDLVRAAIDRANAELRGAL
jgi:orotidine-5'-phosphate decarboxylase